MINRPEYPKVLECYELKGDVMYLVIRKVIDTDAEQQRFVEEYKKNNHTIYLGNLKWADLKGKPFFLKLRIMLSSG